MTEYGIIGVVVFLGSLFAGATIVTSYLLGPKAKDVGKKLDTYECGEDTIGHSKIRFKIGYYLFALLFMVFDVESIFLFPCMKIFKAVTENQIPGITTQTILIELSIFIIILAIGLSYAWRKKSLEWE